MFPWDEFRTRQGAVKLPTVLTGQLPQCLIVTDGRTHDPRAVQDLHFQAGDLLIFDRACLDYTWLYRLHQGGVWFVTPLKRNCCYEAVRSRRAAGPVLTDDLIRLRSAKGQAAYPELLRRVHYRDPETSKEYVSLTNRRDLSALEVAELYRRRQIELFCKWLKQNLRLKAFLDNSENAVFTQIYVALITYWLLCYFKFLSALNISLPRFIPLLTGFLFFRHNEMGVNRVGERRPGSRPRPSSPEFCATVSK